MGILVSGYVVPASAAAELEALQRRLDSGQHVRVDGPRRSRPFGWGGRRPAPDRERRRGPCPGCPAGNRVRPCGQLPCGLAGCREDRPGDLGGLRVVERVPAAPVAATDEPILKKLLTLRSGQDFDHALPAHQLTNRREEFFSSMEAATESNFDELFKLLIATVQN